MPPFEARAPFAYQLQLLAANNTDREGARAGLLRSVSKVLRGILASKHTTIRRLVLLID